LPTSTRPTPKKGLLPTPNLTPDKTTGLGDWTDKQIKNAFQNGLDSDDKPLFSVMPYYVFHNMSDADADSIVMYLRSIPAVKNEIPERQDLGFPVMQAQPVPADMLPDTTLEPSDANYDSAQNGRYLAAKRRRLHGVPHRARSRRRGAAHARQSCSRQRNLHARAARPCRRSSRK